MSRRFSPYPRLSAQKKRDFAFWTWSVYVLKKKQAKWAIEAAQVEAGEATYVEEILINGTLYLRDNENMIYDFKTEDPVGKYDFNLDLWLTICHF